MKKSLIALAVAGAFVAPAAMADTSNVTIYGAANLSFDMVSNGANLVANPAAPNSGSTNSVSSNVSKLGFKGTEDLGDGLSAVWQIEQQINFNQQGAGPTSVSAGGNTFASRNTYAGLSSTSMGTVIMGIHDTPYKISTRGYDLFGDTIADNRSIMGQAGAHDARLNNVFAYISPKLGGFTIAAATATGAQLPVVNGATGTVKGSAVSLAGMYSDGPINAALAYQTITAGTAGTGTLGGALGLAQNDKVSAWKLGGGYTFDAFQVNAVYEKTSSTIAATGLDTLGRSNFYLSGKYSFGNDAVKLAYTNAGKVNNTLNSESSQLSVGYDHSLSKRTSVYALYSKISNKLAANYTFSQATSAGNANGGVGSTPSVFSLGMKHAF